MSGLPQRFTRVWVSADSGLSAAGLPAALARAVLEGLLVKDEAQTLLARAPLPTGGAGWWKLYRLAGGRRWLSPLARSRARREGQALRSFAAAGVAAAPVLAWAEDRRAGLLRASLLVTRDISGARDLRALCADPLLALAEKRRWLRAAGAAARNLHEAGFGHFRLQLRNLLAAGPDRIVLLDAPYACAFRFGAPAAVRALDLVDLAGAGSGLGVADSAVVLSGYGAPEPLALEALRRRSALAQKLRRIGWYLFYNNTGHRPAPVP